MESETLLTPELKLEASIDPDHIIRLFVSGKLTNDRFFVFVAWTEKVKRLIRESAVKETTPILILSDVSGVTYFERKLIAPLRELLAYDKNFPLKSAIVGASSLTSALLRAVISLTGRTNIKLFPSEVEAREWLNEKESPVAVKPGA